MTSCGRAIMMTAIAKKNLWNLTSMMTKMTVEQWQDLFGESDDGEGFARF